jgi:TonB family protein
MSTENELNRLLLRWPAPAAPQELQSRLTNSFFGINHQPVSPSPITQWARRVRARLETHAFGLASPRNVPAHPEVQMKRCNACKEEFADKFSFCPVDGTPLNSLAAALVGKEPPQSHNVDERSADLAAPVFQLTMISSAGLWRRLATEVSFLVAQLQRTWPDFKRDPIAVCRRSATALGLRLRTLILQPNVLAGVTTAIMLVLSVSLALLLSGRGRVLDRTLDRRSDELVEILSLAVPTQPEGAGMGVGSNGRVGLSKGKGEGSEAVPKPAHGGGGGGERSKHEASQGGVPPPSEIAARISPPLPNAALPVAGVDLDPALWSKLPLVAFGDPRSKSLTPSNGPGEGGGVGAGKGLGDGPGSGNGFGPGEDGNTGGGKKGLGGAGPGGSDGTDPSERDRVYRVPEVTQRARVLSKPEPQYTEVARKNQVTGSVILSVVFSESGQVTNIRALRTLPDGLTEKAIAAARQIRFVPASRNGQAVSVYMQLEYNFNLY